VGTYPGEAGYITSKSIIENGMMKAGFFVFVLVGSPNLKACVCLCASLKDEHIDTSVSEFLKQRS
jgi:hypothetical protein